MARTSSRKINPVTRMNLSTFSGRSHDAPHQVESTKTDNGLDKDNKKIKARQRQDSISIGKGSGVHGVKKNGHEIFKSPGSGEKGQQQQDRATVSRKRSNTREGFDLNGKSSFSGSDVHKYPHFSGQDFLTSGSLTAIMPLTKHKVRVSLIVDGLMITNHNADGGTQNSAVKQKRKEKILSPGSRKSRERSGSNLSGTNGTSDTTKSISVESKLKSDTATGKLSLLPLPDKVQSVDLSKRRTRRTVMSNPSNSSFVKNTISGRGNLQEQQNEENPSNLLIGDDGNLYFCHFCKGMGNVVCCDGCPRVFHPSCLPEGQSKLSLNSDDDPWYCPICLPNVKGTSGRGRANSRKKADRVKEKEKEKEKNEVVPVKTETPEPTMPVPTPTIPPPPKEKKRQVLNSVTTKCFDCKKTGGVMLQCKSCSVYLHSPSCIVSLSRHEDNDKNKKEALQDIEDPTLHPQLQCYKCLAGEFVTKEHVPGEENKKKESEMGTKAKTEIDVDIENETKNKNIHEKQVKRENLEMLEKEQESEKKETIEKTGENGNISVHEETLPLGVEAGNSAPNTPVTELEPEEEPEAKPESEEIASLPVLPLPDETPNSKEKPFIQILTRRVTRAAKTKKDISYEDVYDDLTEVEEESVQSTSDKKSELASAKKVQNSTPDENTGSEIPEESSKRSRETRRRRANTYDLGSHEPQSPLVLSPRESSTSRNRSKHSQKSQITPSRKRRKENGHKFTEEYIETKLPEGNTRKRRRARALSLNDFEDTPIKYGKRNKKKSKRLRTKSFNSTTTTKAPSSPQFQEERESGKHQSQLQRSSSKLSTSNNFNNNNNNNNSKIPKRPVSLIPPFFFYLAETKNKIDRMLVKKESGFQKMRPKSIERYQRIARECAKWWGKLTPYEKKKWEKISTKDFEDRVIEWKENILLANMNIEPPNENNEEDTVDADNNIIQSPVSENNHIPQHDLFLKFGQKPPDENNNRPVISRTLNKATVIRSKLKNYEFDTQVEKGEGEIREGESSMNTCSSRTLPSIFSKDTILCEVLRDSRFHPIPMLDPRRKREDFGFNDTKSKVLSTFEVQGPISSSLGDVCLGCARGWHHYCPILKQQFPVVECRSKLQPPLSSLSATRIGLGIKSHDEDMQLYRNNSCLVQPSVRQDDVSKLIEEALLLKRPRKINSSNSGGAFVQSHHTIDGDCGISLIHEESNHEHNENTSNQHGSTRSYECGKCGGVTHCINGCIHCRRSLLLGNVAKRHGPSSGDLKVNTAILRRVYDCNSLKQKKGERAVAAALSSTEWKPNTIMPPNIPLRLGERQSKNKEESDEEEVDASSESDTNDIEESTDNNVQESSLTITPTADTPAQKNNKTITPKQIHHIRRTPRRLASSLRLDSEMMLQPYTTHWQEDNQDPEFRQDLAIVHKREATILQKKCLRSAMAGILLGLMRRDPLRLFFEPVPRSVENYHKLITNPIDFRSIREKLLGEEYSSLGAMVSDLKLLCNNALLYNPSDSIYASTAQDMSKLLEVMQKRAQNWMKVIQNTHASAYTKQRVRETHSVHTGEQNNEHSPNVENTTDLFDELRNEWPDAVNMLENDTYFLSHIKSDFVRTEENEGAYYASLAVRRAVAAAALSTTNITTATVDSENDHHKPCLLRSAEEDENLRSHIDSFVSQISDPTQLMNESGWIENALLKHLRDVQTFRVEEHTKSESGCARTEGPPTKKRKILAARAAKHTLWQIQNNKVPRVSRDIDNTVSRISASRLGMSTGQSSQRVVNRSKEQPESKSVGSSIENSKSVSVRGSDIHGWVSSIDCKF